MKARFAVGWTALVALLTAILLFPLYWMAVTALVPTAQVCSRASPRSFRRCPTSA